MLTFQMKFTLSSRIILRNRLLGALSLLGSANAGADCAVVIVVTAIVVSAIVQADAPTRAKRHTGQHTAFHGNSQ